MRLLACKGERQEKTSELSGLQEILCCLMRKLAFDGNFEARVTKARRMQLARTSLKPGKAAAMAIFPIIPKKPDTVRLQDLGCFCASLLRTQIHARSSMMELQLQS